MLDKKLVIVNGFPRSGKDSFIKFSSIHLTHEGYTSISHSTIDSVKRWAKEMGWDGEKTLESRKMLSDLKDLYTEYFDGPLNEIKNLMISGKQDILFTCMREPKEIEKTVSWCKEAGFKVITILISSDRGETNHLSHSDLLVKEYDYDWYLNNYGDLQHLKELAESFSEMALITK